MATDGSVLLEPAETLRLSAAELYLQPGETAEVAVDLTAPHFSNTEETYRIGISDRGNGLPTGAGAFQALATVTLPVFRRPADARPDGWLDARAQSDGLWTVTIGNRGRAHLFARDVTVRGVDDDGNGVFTAERNGWYVLAGGRRDYRITLAAEDCRRSRRMILSAVLLDGSSIEQTVDMAGQPCSGQAPTGFSFPDAGIGGSSLGGR